MASQRPTPGEPDVAAPQSLLRRALLRWGVGPVAVIVTLGSIVASLAIALLVHVLGGMVFTATAFWITVLCPALIAPLMSVNNFRLALQLERARVELRHLSETDHLTGAWNRRYLMDRLREELARSERGGLPFALALLDVDNFKLVNDRHGHLAGDEVLRTLAEACRAEVRSIDTFARFGGEEFAVLLPQTTGADALLWLQRLCRHVEALRVELPEAVISVTVSIGVTAVDGSGEAPVPGLSELLRRADEALYAAKRNGKNRVSAALGLAA